MLKIYSRFRLVRRIVKLKKLAALLRTGKENVIAFKEEPSAGKLNKPVDHQITATDLFSMFTADIISSNKVFVR